MELGDMAWVFLNQEKSLSEAGVQPGSTENTQENSTPSTSSSDETASEESNLTEIQAPADRFELTEDEKWELGELRAIDRRVRAHEQAHRAVAGQYALGATFFQYERGPDGQQYAVAGEVKLDTAEIRDNPEATVRKMQTVKRAALAPRDPSAQDRRVAAEAAGKETNARLEISRQETSEFPNTGTDFLAVPTAIFAFVSAGQAPASHSIDLLL